MKGVARRTRMNADDNAFSVLIEHTCAYREQSSAGQG
jgi:hypothetical protein